LRRERESGGVTTERERVVAAIFGRRRVWIEDGWHLMEWREMKVEGRAVVLCGREWKRQC
jgi:hypothetical protein